MSRRPKDISLLNPDDGKTVLGNLRVTRMQNGERNRTMIFYELTWSDITAAEKNCCNMTFPANIPTNAPLSTI
ncbi:MAG: hypothetical protein ACLU99_02960 [Alphaproteobacteria bacterium]